VICNLELLYRCEILKYIQSRIVRDISHKNNVFYKLSSEFVDKNKKKDFSFVLDKNYSGTV